MPCSPSLSFLPPDQKRKFQSVFNVPVDPFWDRILGFDIIKFDDEFLSKYPESNQDGYSARDVVVKYFGEEAAAFIDQLINLDPLDQIVRILAS